jgi:hypothetical protein
LGSLLLPAAAAAYLPRRLAGRDEIRAWGEKVPTFVDFLVQTTYPGIIALDGDLASGRAYMQELGRARDGRSALNYAVDTTATGGRATAGNSPSVCTRSCTRTPVRWPALRALQTGGPLAG